MKLDESQLARALQDDTADHPDSQTLARLLEPAQDAGQREAVLKHLETCSACTAQLQLLLELHPQTVRLANELTGVQSSAVPARRRWLLPVSAAAAMLMAVAIGVLVVSPPKPPPSVLRGAGADVVPAHQSTLERMPAALTWTQPFTQAVSVRLMDAAANTLWQSEPTESSQVALPAELQLEPGTYLWQLEGPQAETVAGPYWFRMP